MIPLKKPRGLDLFADLASVYARQIRTPKLPVP